MLEREEPVEFDYLQKDMMEALHQNMMSEAWKISRASELFFKKKLELTKGKVPLKEQQTNTLSWNALTRDYQVRVEEAV